MPPLLGDSAAVTKVTSGETFEDSVTDAGVAPWVMSVGNGTGVATIVLLDAAADELGSAAGSVFSFGMMTGEEPEDVAMSGAGNEGVPWPG